MYETTRKI